MHDGELHGVVDSPGVSRGRLTWSSFSQLILLIILSGPFSWGCAALGTPSLPRSLAPVTVIGVVAPTALTAGVTHACALLSDGRIKCWGDNSLGQLGDGTTGKPPEPVFVSEVSTATELSAGGAHTCALLAGGEIACWGANQDGQLGSGTVTNSPLPIEVDAIHHATAVAAGWAHTCALLSDGTVRCWGNNNAGQLGNGTITSSPIPTAVANVSAARGITTGVAHACAVLEDGTVRCWGTDGFGQHPTRAFSFRSTYPVLVPDLGSVTAVSAGRNHTCALLNDRGLKCWGSNIFAQLGGMSGAIASTRPISVVGVSDATAISAGGFHTCALLVDKAVKCWGANLAGQLGSTTGKGSLSFHPLAVTAIPPASAVASGGAFTCALLVNGSVACWGGNEYGQLGGGAGRG